MTPEQICESVNWIAPGHADYDHYIEECEVCQRFVVDQIIELAVADAAV